MVTAGEASRVASPFLTSAEVVARYRFSKRTIAELTRTGAIPFLQRVAGARCLFRLADLENWEDGAELETVALPNGGRLVRPRT
jgi:hypothetical protein